MKNTKLIIGIISMVLCVFILFQSCAAGLVNALEENGQVSGTAGAMTAILILVAGIVAVATKNSQKKGGNIASAILYGIGGIIGLTGAGNYSDLIIWSILSFIFAAVFVVFAIKTQKNATGFEGNTPSDH